MFLHSGLKCWMSSQFHLTLPLAQLKLLQIVKTLLQSGAVLKGVARWPLSKMIHFRISEEKSMHLPEMLQGDHFPNVIQAAWARSCFEPYDTEALVKAYSGQAKLPEIRSIKEKEKRSQH